MRIILASKSPRRRELLSLLNLDFTVMSEEVDETIDQSLPIESEIKRLSLEKAKAVASKAGENSIIISADTAVVLGDRVFGKPKDRAAAVGMLRALSGKTHKVITGVTVLSGAGSDTRAAVTEVTFKELNDAEINAYIDTGDPFDKAGAYALQGISCVFVSGIKGDHFNVYGLPVSLLADMLRGFGVRILDY
ncbi:MAG: septum formation protein Maf [Clostridia bacterium]|nr:septum formation protein Maf [Clostridia bacterium]